MSVKACPHQLRIIMNFTAKTWQDAAINGDRATFIQSYFLLKQQYKDLQQLEVKQE